MSFEDNKDTIENVYEEMIDNLSPELSENKYYQYFYDQIKDYKKGAKYADTKNHSS